MFRCSETFAQAEVKTIRSEGEITHPKSNPKLTVTANGFEVSWELLYL